LKEIKTVSIIGLGALGILFGHQMSKKMPKEDLRIIADESRIKKYKSQGLYCNGEPCNFSYVTPEAKISPADLLIFAVKFTQLNDAIDAAKNQVGENTVILSLLNGISSEEIIGNAFGSGKVLYCVAQGMDAVKEGNRLICQNMGKICIGERQTGEISDRVKMVADFFEKTNVPYEIETDIYKRMWGKLMLNVGVNQTVALFESDYGEIQRDTEARKIMLAAMREVLELSKKEGINLTEADFSYWVNLLDTLNPRGKPSMRQDMEAKRYSEVELFAGTIVKLGKKHNFPTPVNDMLYKRITEIESKY